MTSTFKKYKLHFFIKAILARTKRDRNISSPLGCHKDRLDPTNCQTAVDQDWLKKSWDLLSAATSPFIVCGQFYILSISFFFETKLGES